MTLATIAALVVRYGLVMLFLPFSALDKLLGFNHAVGQAQEVFKSRSRCCSSGSSSRSSARSAS